MKISFGFVIILVFLTSSSFAQSNSIEVEISKLYFNTKHSNKHIKYATLKYQRIISRNIKIGLELSPKTFNYKHAFWSAHGYDSLGLNSITKSDNIHFATVTLSYFKSLSIFTFSLHSGLSTALSNNFYMTELVLAPAPPFGEGDIIWLDGYWKRDLYFGIPIGLKFCYPIYKNKVTINAHANYTKFTKEFPSTYSFGISVGYKF